MNRGERGPVRVSAHSCHDVLRIHLCEGAVLSTLVEHWDGSQWTIVPSPNPGNSDNTLTESGFFIRVGFTLVLVQR